MSRLPRALEHLKTGFAAEAATAARYRAQAGQAEAEGKPNLAARWLALAEEKDRLARLLLQAAGQIRGEDRALADALAEEAFENEILYPKMIREVDAETARVLADVVAAQGEHAQALERLRSEAQAAGGDVAAAA